MEKEMSHRDIYYKVVDEVCDEEFLKFAIDYLELKTIYCNQILSDDFIRNYILNPEYHSCVEDSYITYDHVVKVQKAIKNKSKFLNKN